MLFCDRSTTEPIVQMLRRQRAVATDYVIDLGNLKLG